MLYHYFLCALLYLSSNANASPRGLTLGRIIGSGKPEDPGPGAVSTYRTYAFNNTVGIGNGQQGVLYPNAKDTPCFDKPFTLTIKGMNASDAFWDVARDQHAVSSIVVESMETNSTAKGLVKVVPKDQQHNPKDRLEYKVLVPGPKYGQNHQLYHDAENHGPYGIGIQIDFGLGKGKSGQPRGFRSRPLAIRVCAVATLRKGEQQNKEEKK